MQTILKNMQTLSKAIISKLTEFQAVLRQTDTEFYTHQQDIFSGSSVGMHTRHIIEFYVCLFNQSAIGLSINYDLRERNMLLETNPYEAISKINWVIKQLTEIQEDKPLQLNTMQFEKIITSFYRELYYNYEHLIHHLAIIRIGLQLYRPKIFLPENFDVADSTIRFKQNLQA